MSNLNAKAAAFAPRSTNWADDDDEEDGGLREQFEALSPKKPVTSATVSKDEPSAPATDTEIEDQPVASLASRIGGLSTSSTSSPAPASTPAARPKPNTSNNLFGKALAGVKTDRTPTSSAPPPSSASASTSAPAPAPAPVVESHSGKELLPPSDTSKEKGKMTMNLMDDDNGWGEQPVTKNANGNGNGTGNGHLAAPADDIKSERMSEGTGIISNDFQVEVKLADLQADPSSPLYSIKAFEELPIHPDLMKGIYAVGFKKPSKIQEKALPLLLHNPPRNLIGQSQSGTGKTAAFTLNMLSRVDPGLMTPQAICLAPSRELARQIQEVIDKIGQFTPIKTMLAVPGSWSRNTKIDKHILIATPGTMMDMLSRNGKIFDPKMIRVLVLDEADEMLAQQGLGDQTTRIKRMLPAGVQNVLFSATFTEEVQAFASEFAPEANSIFLKKEEVTVDAIKQLYLECDGEEAKFDALSALYDVMVIGQSMVFCKRKDTADRIAARLIKEGHSVASLHGDKQTQERDAILDGFREGKTKVLITTNVVARGIDIQQVNMVVNYDVPDLGSEGGFRPDIETYIHRIGRTGRFGRKGCSVIFSHDTRSMQDINDIMQALGKPMRRIDASSNTDLEQLEKALKAALKGTT